ncbi:hypothetical protein PHMEG_00030884 [Phytophthora megakarya]|uniref:Uncharacterized protein n=1 Tax=Phytophthora megakarya TaxID=4795 RepID=A0A225V029_9STRA|nr:hypothetical protein PHMEG_00030884 [Phytophthora megakarya]
MDTGFGYRLAVPMMGDNGVTHQEFPENQLCDNLVQMMHHPCLDKTPWTQRIHDPYFTTADVTLRGIEIADSEGEDDQKDEDYHFQEGVDGAIADDDKECSSSGEDIFSRPDSKNAKYPDLVSSSDESSEDIRLKQSFPSKRGSPSPITSSGVSSECASEIHTSSTKRSRPRGSNERAKSRLAMLRYQDLTDADKAGMKIVSRHRRGILTRFSPKEDGSEQQTLGFPDYAY